MKRFDGKVAFVTGAAAGIGRSTAIRLAQEGGSLFLVDIHEDGLRDTAALCEKEGAATLYARCDVTDEAEVHRIIQSCVDHFGRLDVLCNIAGILALGHFQELSLEGFRRVIEVNLLGTFMFCQAALPHLLKTRGAIVNTSSTAALAGMPYGSAYGSSKGGVSALTRSLAVEFGKRGVRVNAVCPGSIKTAMMGSGMLPADADPELVKRAHAISPPADPELVASVIAMLASGDGAHINGEEIRVDGGTLS
jgi:NAD(P)-dependent dehydrogenase (short-subunit alcohol dehydrogenase family)